MLVPNYTSVDNMHMSENILLNDSDYRKLRTESREALRRLGLASNPSFTNRNIFDGLADALGVVADFPEEADLSEYSGEMFRDSLGEILGLELPVEVDDVVFGLSNIHP